jgi:hypothetical protein
MSISQNSVSFGKCSWRKLPISYRISICGLCNFLRGKKLSQKLKFWESLINIPKKNKICIFDRGIPDLIIYAELFNIDTKIYYNAAKEYKYIKNVFFFK